jgi:hypothetical protein
MGTKADPRKRMIFYQYRADRARRTLKGIDQQIVKAEKAAAGQAAVKRNRFVQLTGATKTINRVWKPRPGAGRVEGLRHQPARPDRGVCDGRLPPAVADREELPDVQIGSAGAADLPPQSDSIEAHLTIVFAALAVTRWLERRTDWSIKKLITSLRSYHTIEIQAGDQIVTAADPLPNDIRATLQRLHGSE